MNEAGYEITDADATPFVYGRAPRGDDHAFVALAARRGVLLLPSRLFHEPGFFRIALNTDRAALDRALDVLADLRADEGQPRE